MIRILTIYCLFASFHVAAQSEIKTSQAFLFTPHYAFQTPGADLKERFESFSSIGLGADFKFKNNIILGVDYDWYFGNSVVDNGIFNKISGNQGQIIDKNGNFSIIGLNIKGNYGTVNLGYLINLPKIEKYSGILVSVGAGVMQHKIAIQAAGELIPQLNEEYIKGYDKLTYGFATKQYIGYQYFVSKNKYHIRAGVEFNQGFTTGRRTWDFNANKSGLDKRLDITTALKVGIVVPVYTKKANDEEFFID